MKRTPLRANPDKIAAWLRRNRRALPAQSPKRAAEQPRRRTVVETVHDRQAGKCWGYNLPGECGGPLDVHEIIPRGRGGDHLSASVLHVIGLCRRHHEYVTRNPVFAEARGYVMPSWSSDEMLLEACLQREANRGALPKNPPSWWTPGKIDLYWGRA